MSLVTLRNRVSAALDRDDLSNTDLNRFINDAQRLICRSHNFDFMQTHVTATTVNYQQAYALPDGTDARRFKQDIRVELENSSQYRIPLIRRTLRDLDDDPAFTVRPDGTSDDGCGTPSHYAISNNTLYLYKAPDHASNDDTAWTIHIAYYGYLDDLTTDDDTNRLVDEYPELVAAYAIGFGFQHVWEEERAAYWLNLAGEMLRSAAKSDRAHQFAGIETGFEPGYGQSLGGRRVVRPWRYV